jgi:hypothetical protein
MVSAEGLQQELLSGERQQLHPRNGLQCRQEILSRLPGRLASTDLNANRFQTHLVAACLQSRHTRPRQVALGPLQSSFHQPLARILI